MASADQVVSIPPGAGPKPQQFASPLPPAPELQARRPRVSWPEGGHLLGPVGETSLLKLELFNSCKTSALSVSQERIRMLVRGPNTRWRAGVQIGGGGGPRAWLSSLASRPGEGAPAPLSAWRVLSPAQRRLRASPGRTSPPTWSAALRLQPLPCRPILPDRALKKGCLFFNLVLRRRAGKACLPSQAAWIPKVPATSVRWCHPASPPAAQLGGQTVASSTAGAHPG